MMNRTEILRLFHKKLTNSLYRNNSFKKKRPKIIKDLKKKKIQ